MNKKQMVAALVDHSIDTATQDPARDWLRQIFARGFVGFDKRTQAQLVQEMEFRGLLATDNRDDATPDDLDDMRDEDAGDAERLVMWSGMIRMDSFEPITD